MRTLMNVCTQPYRVENTELEVPAGLILLAYRGSKAHGLYVPQEDKDSIDDVDLIGFAVGEKRHYFGLAEWGSRGTFETWQEPYDCVWYEVRKAVTLLLQGNPNILGTLWARDSAILHREAEGKYLSDNRYLFVGKHVYRSFAGYANHQLTKMESREPAEVREYLGVTHELKRRGKHPTDQNISSLGDAINCGDWSTEKLLARYRHYARKGENLGYLGDKRKRLVLEHGYDAKNAAHCIRLLRMCCEFLETGEMRVERVIDRQELLDIKAGKWELARVKQLAEGLFAEARQCCERSKLPEEPDAARAERLLITVIESWWDRKRVEMLRQEEMRFRGWYGSENLIRDQVLDSAMHAGVGSGADREPPRTRGAAGPSAASNAAPGGGGE